MMRFFRKKAAVSVVVAVVETTDQQEIAQAIPPSVTREDVLRLVEEVGAQAEEISRGVEQKDPNLSFLWSAEAV